MKTLEELLTESDIKIIKQLNSRSKLVYNVYHGTKLIDTHNNIREAKISAIIIQDSLTTKII